MQQHFSSFFQTSHLLICTLCSNRSGSTFLLILQSKPLCSSSRSFWNYLQYLSARFLVNMTMNIAGKWFQRCPFSPLSFIFQTTFLLLLNATLTARTMCCQHGTAANLGQEKKEETATINKLPESQIFQYKQHHFHKEDKSLHIPCNENMTRTNRSNSGALVRNSVHCYYL